MKLKELQVMMCFSDEILRESVENKEMNKSYYKMVLIHKQKLADHLNKDVSELTFDDVANHFVSMMLENAEDTTLALKAIKQTIVNSPEKGTDHSNTLNALTNEFISLAKIVKGD